MSKYLNKKHSVNSFALFTTLFCASLIFLLLLIFLFKAENFDYQGLIFLALLSGFMILVISVITLLRRSRSERGNLISETTDNREGQTHDQVIEDLQNEKKYFASILSHDLRSPLSSIVLLTSYLKSKDENPEALKYIELIEQSTRKELDLMATLLALMRVESFKPEQAEVLPLHLTLTEILKNAESQLTKKQIEVAIDIGPELSVFANSQSFNLILKTLIGQAICYSDEGKIIEIKATQDNQSVVLEVALSSEELRKNAGAQLFHSTQLSLQSSGNSFPECIPLYFLEKAISPYNGIIRVQQDENNPVSRFILTFDRLGAPYSS